MSKKPTEPSDFGTPELRRHYEYHIAQASVHKKRVQIDTQLPIDRYLKRKMITERQHEAANRFHQDWHQSHPFHGLTMDMNPEKIKGTGDGAMEGGLDSLKRYLKVVESLSNEISRKLIVDVCGYGEEIKDVVVYPYRNSSELMSRFKEALDELVKIYGIA